jgi:hypothetical protein
VRRKSKELPKQFAALLFMCRAGPLEGQAIGLPLVAPMTEASNTFTPATLKDKPPQGNDAKCGFACHSAVKTKDYVFTDYGHR